MYLIENENNVEEIDFLNDSSPDQDDMEAKKQKAQSIIAFLKSQSKKPKDNSAQNIVKKVPNQNEFKQEEEPIIRHTVMPDPESQYNIRLKTAKDIKMMAIEDHNKVITKIQENKLDARRILTKQEIDKIVKSFKYKVIKIGKTEVVLKGTKFGFEIYFSNTDKRYWVTAVVFEEPYNPMLVKYRTYWIGNSFIGYGLATLDEVLLKTRDMMFSGKTGNILFRDYLSEWNEKSNRIIAASEPKKLTLTELKRFIKWFEFNKIRIMIKSKDTTDMEDIMTMTRELEKAGKVVPLKTKLAIKFAEKPRRSNFMAAYPVEKPGVTDNFQSPNNKLYEIAFTYTDQ